MNNTAASDTLCPRTWVLTGHKAGDNTQVLALAEALGWPYEVKQFRYKWYELLTNRLLGVTLAGIDRTHSSALQPPWPELVITAGRRNEPVARWLRRQSRGATRLVHVGRPWAPLDVFDLIVTTPQYFVPQRDNVMYVDLPLHQLTRARLDALAGQWLPRFASLPRPYWAVLLGGNSGPFVFTADKALGLARWLNRVVGASGGAVLVTNSARTPPPAYQAFLAELQVPVNAFHWGSAGAENPYPGYLAVADALVVTGESMSMLAEAVAAGRPLYIADLSDCPKAPYPGTPGCRPWWLYGHNFRYKPLSHRIAMAIAPRRMRRDIGRIQNHLVESGQAAWAGQAWQGQTPTAAESDRPRVAARLRALFQSPAN